jgi:hypothetical protein
METYGGDIPDKIRLSRDVLCAGFTESSQCIPKKRLHPTLQPQSDTEGAQTLGAKARETVHG